MDFVDDYITGVLLNGVSVLIPGEYHSLDDTDNACYVEQDKRNSTVHFLSAHGLHFTYSPNCTSERD